MNAVAVGFMAIGLCVVECLQLLTGSALVSRLLFPHKVSAVVEQVTRQQEASQREDQQAKVDLKDRWVTEVERYTVLRPESIHLVLLKRCICLSV